MKENNVKKTKRLLETVAVVGVQAGVATIAEAVAHEIYPVIAETITPLGVIPLEINLILPLAGIIIITRNTGNGPVILILINLWKNLPLPMNPLKLVLSLPL